VIVEPGAVYLVQLQLFNAAHFSPSWLVGAFAGKYPQADVVSIDEYAADRAVVRIRWRSPDQGQIIEGARVSAVIEGLALPTEAVPSATILAVQPTGQVAQSVETLVPDSAKLLMAGVMLAVTWYFTSKIRTKHG